MSNVLSSGELTPDSIDSIARWLSMRRLTTYNDLREERGARRQTLSVAVRWLAQMNYDKRKSKMEEILNHEERRDSK